MKSEMTKKRNIGISAHIDSGKTTLTERILFYCKKIHKMHEVRGKDGVGATMDSMELEKERGITIASAATTVSWSGHSINIIDTPGHVDFTIEVEKALRVLDGAILVLCAVGGVQSQTISVDRQLKRYNVPRIAFINKLDRTGANPLRVKDQLKERLGHNAVLMQIPVGLEDKHEGIVDLVAMKAVYFEGKEGEIVRSAEIPNHLKAEAKKKREKLLDAASMFSDELMEAVLEGRETEDLIHAAVRSGAITRKLTPVFMGSAYKNKGVQPLLDAVVRYLPNPAEVDNFALDLDHEGQQVRLSSNSDTTSPHPRSISSLSDQSDASFGATAKGSAADEISTTSAVEQDAPISMSPKINSSSLSIPPTTSSSVTDAKPGNVALAFKLEDGPFGQLTYIRIYQGHVEKGTELYNTRSRNKFRVGRLVRMHAERMEDISEAGAGDIAALFGIDCRSGDTFVTPGLNYAMTSIHIPEPVMSLAVRPADSRSSDSMAKAMNRFAKEDPTFRAYVDPESKQTIIQGMGELHLDVYLERMRREYRADVETGAPQVAYREAISRRAEFDYTHRKQTGGAGQYGRVIGFVEPLSDGHYEFVDLIKGGRIPREFVASCDKGFRAATEKGLIIGFPVVGVRVTLVDGQSHPVDSSDVAFQTAAKEAFKQAFRKAQPQILEPIMKLSVECPSEFIGSVFGSINQRRGIIVSTVEDGTFARVDAEVPLSEMFGYATSLRTLTQGKAEFSMEFLKYGRVPETIAESLKDKYVRTSK